MTRRYGWMAVIRQALSDFSRHRMTVYAGNFAYSAFLALFPLILLAAAIVGLVFNNNPGVMQQAVDGLLELFPGMAATMEGIVESLVRLRNVVGVVGLVGLLWTVSKISYAIQTGFAEVWETRGRSFVKKRLLALGIIMLVLLIGIAGLVVTFLSSHLLSWINERSGPLISALTLILGNLINPAAIMFVLAILYRAIPLEKPGWREVFWGALMAAMLLYVSEHLIGFYFSKVSNAEALYGSLGVLLGLVLWLYIVGIIVFLGAEIVRVMHKRRGIGGGGAEGLQAALPEAVPPAERDE
jgi:membrane protein